MCEAICCFGILEAAAAVSGDTGHRVTESTPRAAATTREARTPNPDRRTISHNITTEYRYWKPFRNLRMLD